MSVSRNDPCPCGSGQKYKKCCINKEASPERVAGAPPKTARRWLPFAGAAVLGVGVGIWQDPGAGIIVGIATAICGVLVTVLRNPPPPNETAGNPAGLDFGNRPPVKERERRRR